MKLTPSETTFLNMIKTTCINRSRKENILPSVVAAVGIINSSCGTSNRFLFTRNIFSLTVNKNWNGKCYSEDSQIIYNKKEECKESAPILYKVYDSHLDSINDFIDYLVMSKRSKNGPYRYHSIIGCTSYKATVDKLVRAGFMQDHFNRLDDVAFIQHIINTIEYYRLFEWDKEEKNVQEKEDNSK